MRNDWVSFDGWCASNGVDPLDMPADRVCHLYRYLLERNADEDTREQIARALEPPVTYRVNGAPAWYGSDEDAWAEFARNA